MLLYIMNVIYSNTLDCISFYQDAAYRVGGIVIYKDEHGNLQCRIGKRITIQHFADRNGPTSVYDIPNGIQYFNENNKPKTFTCLSKGTSTKSGHLVPKNTKSDQK